MCIKQLSRLSNKYSNSVLLVMLIILLASCGAGSQSALAPPEGSSGDNVPLYSNAQNLTVSETDAAALVSDMYGSNSLLYSSSTDISWTEDIGSRVQEQLDQSLPDANWRIETDWVEFGQFQISEWRNGDLRLVVFYFDNLDSTQINDFNKRFGISGLQPGSTLIVTHIWDTTQPLPTATPTGTPVPTQTPLPTNTPLPTPTFTPRPTNTPLPTPTNTPTPISTDMQIPFASQSGSTSLAEGWGWFPGSSESNDYKVSPDTGVLTLIAGPSTDLWDNRSSAPRVEYSLSGDFQAQVRLDFDPTERWQVAGLGIRSGQDSGTWAAIRRYCCEQVIDVAQTLNHRSETLVTAPYAKAVIYLRMTRVGERLSFSTSENGINWVDIEVDHIFSLPDQVSIFLYAYSTTGKGVIAEFSELRVGPPQERQVYSPGDSFAFTSNIDPVQLDSTWGWFPGGAIDSTFSIRDRELTLIAGPSTDLWDNRNSAPRVEHSLSGDFQAQVRVDFDPTERWQTAGLGIRSGQDLGTWAAIRRYCCEQVVDAARTLNYRSETLVTEPYADTTIYLRVERIDPLISLYYSSDGTNWNAILEDFVMSFPEETKIFLDAYSTTDKGVSASFSELMISHP